LQRRNSGTIADHSHAAAQAVRTLQRLVVLDFFRSAEYCAADAQLSDCIGTKLAQLIVFSRVAVLAGDERIFNFRRHLMAARKRAARGASKALLRTSSDSAWRASSRFSSTARWKDFARDHVA
jgi:hypothetical protein